MTTRALSRQTLVVALSLLVGGCTIGRIHHGAPLRADPAAIVEGESTKEDVLRQFGPPVEIAHQTDGDAFIYRYDRRNFSSLTLEEPVFTGLMIFSYRRQFDAGDRLVVLFDFDGVVRAVAFEQQTGDLPTL